MYATERERGKGREKSKSKERVPPATERAASYAKGDRCPNKRQQMYEMSKRDSEREVERSDGGRSPMAKDTRRKAKGSSDESRIKKEKRNIRKRSEYDLK